MDKQIRNKILVLIVLGLTLLAAVLSLLLGRTFREEPTEPTPPPTEAPTEAPTEPPTEPPEFLNKYGVEDFALGEDGYLHMIEGEARLGIDVSAHQGEIDWTQVAEAGMEFAMIRVGYRGYGTGKIVEDPYFRTNLEGATEAGLDVGVYFFSQAISVEEALEEAAFVLEVLGDTELAMPVVYDWEYIDEEARTAEVDRRMLTDCSLAFLQAVEEAGYEPMLYYNTFQVRRHLHLKELEQYDCWLALYSESMTFPYRIKMWQYTCTGSVPGVWGNVDIDLYFPGE